MQLSLNKKTITQMCMPKELFPTALPDEMDEVLIKIEVLLEYGHIKSVFEEIIQWAYNTPEGLAYEYSKDESDKLYHEWTTWALFFRLIRDKIAFDEERIAHMRAFITRNLRDSATMYSRTALVYVGLILDGDPAWIGTELMTPGLSGDHIQRLVSTEMNDMFDLQ